MGAPLDCFAFVEGYREGHVGVFSFDVEFFEPRCHVWIVGGVVDHESTVNIYFVLLLFAVVRSSISSSILTNTMVAVAIDIVPTATTLHIQRQRMSMPSQSRIRFKNVHVYIIGGSVEVPCSGEAGDSCSNYGYSRWWC